MDENTIVVNGVTYVKKDAPSLIKIAILQRGWVMVGRFERDGNDCALRDAAVIRVWGTTNGLGELARNGKTSKTVLDKCGTVRFDYLTIVALIDCDGSKWKNEL